MDDKDNKAWEQPRNHLDLIKHHHFMDTVTNVAEDIQEFNSFQVDERLVHCHKETDAIVKVQ